MVHQPVSRGFAVFADAWLSGWLAEISADLREAVAHWRWCSTTMRYTNPRLLYFTLLNEVCRCDIDHSVKMYISRLTYELLTALHCTGLTAGRSDLHDS